MSWWGPNRKRVAATASESLVADSSHRRAAFTQK